MQLFREVPVDRDRDDRWRWFLKKKIAADHPNGPMMIRYIIVQAPKFGVYVHQFLRPDADRDTHDHPWWFGTLILWGGYSEEYRPDSSSRGKGNRYWDRPGSWHSMRLENAHRVLTVKPNTWTLLLTGPKIQEWGFWIEQSDQDLSAEDPNPEINWFVPWREYGAQTADPMDS